MTSAPGNRLAEGQPGAPCCGLFNEPPILRSRRLDKFYADEFVATNAQGAVLSKSAVIAALTSGRLKFKSYESEQVDVQIHGNVAFI